MFSCEEQTVLSNSMGPNFNPSRPFHTLIPSWCYIKKNFTHGWIESIKKKNLWLKKQFILRILNQGLRGSHEAAFFNGIYKNGKLSIHPIPTAKEDIQMDPTNWTVYEQFA